MPADPVNPDWWQDWLVLGSFVLLCLLLLPTYVGGLILRLAVGLHNAAAGRAAAVPMPNRGTAMGIIFLATLFNLLVTWSYVNSFGQVANLPGTRLGRGFDDEQQFGPEDLPRTPAQEVVARAIVALRAFLLGMAVLILSRILLPTTPWRAFLVTGNTWLIGAAMLAVVFFLLGVEEILPKRL
ncbi:MAG: hypothetical protein U0797_08695 [Gemmataceae bacterium]